MVWQFITMRQQRATFAQTTEQGSKGPRKAHYFVNCKEKYLSVKLR